MEYKIYGRREILNRCISFKKGRSLAFALFFKVDYFQFGVIYEPNYFVSSNTSHFDFYALSKGFEGFTTTGYRSVFVHNSKKIASYEEIKSYFMELFKEKVLFLEKKPLQFGLF